MSGSQRQPNGVRFNRGSELHAGRCLGACRVCLMAREETRCEYPLISRIAARPVGRRQNRRRNHIEGVHMPILTWVFLGLIAGFIGSKIVNRTGEGLLLDIVLGIVGAVVGGWLFNTFGHAGVSGMNLYSIMVAVVGAIVVLVVYHAMMGGRRRLV